MLAVLRDASCHLQAVLEWWAVDADGRLCDGQTACAVWIEQLEVSPGVAWAGWVKRTIQQIAAWCPKAGGAYWVRKARTGARVHQVTRRALLRYARGEG